MPKFYVPVVCDVTGGIIVKTKDRETAIAAAGAEWRRLGREALDDVSTDVDLANGEDPDEVENITPQFFVTPPAAGYGGRIWMREDDVNEFQDDRLRKWMSKHCMWGGHDKREGDVIAWEFGADELAIAIQTLTAEEPAGFDCVQIKDYDTFWSK